jgi:putative MFS transporter
VGVELVAIDCYLAELVPKAIRGRAFAVSASIQFLSSPLVGLLAYLLVPRMLLGVAGWRYLAFVPAIGALFVWWVRLALPESPRWLAAHGQSAKADAVLRAIENRVARKTGRPLPPADAGVTASPALRQSGFMELWRPPYRRRTVTLIVFHAFQTIGYFGFSNWLPTLLVSQGITLTKTLGYTFLLAFVLPIAPLLFGLFADKAERKWMIVVGALVAATFGLLLARMTQQSNIAAFAMFGAMVTAGTSLMSLAFHTYQSELFPTRMRARAVGFVYSFSRLSAMFSAYLIALVLDRAGSGGVFVLISGSMLVVALTIGLFGPRTRGRSLEQISPR